MSSVPESPSWKARVQAAKGQIAQGQGVAANVKRHVAPNTRPLPALAALEIYVLQLTKGIFARW